MAHAWIGTSGFGYKEWKPKFYPPDVPEKRFLPFYASRFDSVEIDYTFYRMPNRKIIDSWKAATPDGFRFALKASQRITHRERLRLPSDSLGYWLETIAGMGERLGIVLYQLPPFFHCDLERLEAFLAALPGGMAAAFEFRHASWFVDDVYRLLEQSGAALCINDGDDSTTPIRLTAPATYVRLRKSAYPAELREEWTDRIRGWVKEGVDVFAYIKHEDNPDAPLIAGEFAEGLLDAEAPAQTPAYGSG